MNSKKIQRKRWTALCNSPYYLLYKNSDFIFGSHFSRKNATLSPFRKVFFAEISPKMPIDFQWVVNRWNWVGGAEQTHRMKTYSRKNKTLRFCLNSVFGRLFYLFEYPVPPNLTHNAKPLLAVRALLFFVVVKFILLFFYFLSAVWTKLMKCF